MLGDTSRPPWWRAFSCASMNGGLMVSNSSMPVNCVVPMLPSSRGCGYSLIVIMGRSFLVGDDL